MPGIFGFFDYTKEGPGIPANAPAKGPFRTFFDILFRKFWKIVTINLMYILFNAPAIFLAFLLAPYLLQFLFPLFNHDTLIALLKDASASTSTEELEAATSLYLTMAYIVFAMTSVGFSFVVVGPVQAGVTYLLRNYAREEHAFVWMDFKDSARSNFKQSMATGALSLVMLVLLSFAYYWYGNAIQSPILQGLLTGLILVLFLLMTIVLMYVYPMMVTFKVPLGRMLRNAMLLALARFLPNLGILLLQVFLLVLLPFAVALLFPQGFVIFTVLYYFLIAFGLTFLIGNFYVYRQFRKYLIKKEEEKPVEVRAPEL
jgi:uncharacterized membrane protein YesL